MDTKHTGFLNYILGFLVATVIFFLAIFTGFEIEPKTAIRAYISSLGSGKLMQQIFSEIEQNEILTVPPEDILSELRQKRAAYSNTRNLTNQEIGNHNSIIVREDQETVYTLRPNIEVDAHYLMPVKKLNFDPPILYLDAKQSYSEKLRGYLDKESRLHFKVTTTPHGHRTTLPKVQSTNKILVVGDSVAFGYGVNDDQTIASHLQAITGNKLKVINAGVAGYGTDNNMMVVNKYRDAGIENLVYVICENDINHIDGLRKIFKALNSYKSNFQEITIVMHFYISGIMPDIFDPKSASRSKERLVEIEAQLLALSREFHLQYLNWSKITDEYQESERSILSEFALYIDHCHYSPLGNRLLAQHIAKKLLR